MNLNEKEQSTAIDKNYVISTWEDGNLNLDAKLLRGIYAYGFEKPSQIQCQSLYPLTVRPPLDIIAQAQSGTGKTGAFSIGTLCKIDESKEQIQSLGAEFLTVSIAESGDG